MLLFFPFLSLKSIYKGLRLDFETSLTFGDLSLFMYIRVSETSFLALDESLYLVGETSFEIITLDDYSLMTIFFLVLLLIELSTLHLSSETIL